MRTIVGSGVAPFGITCNIILPGRVATDRIRVLDEQKVRREGRPLAEITGLIPHSPAEIEPPTHAGRSNPEFPSRRPMPVEKPC